MLQVEVVGRVLHVVAGRGARDGLVCPTAQDGSVAKKEVSLLQWWEIVTGYPASRRAARNDLHRRPG